MVEGAAVDTTEARTRPAQTPAIRSREMSAIVAHRGRRVWQPDPNQPRMAGTRRPWSHLKSTVGKQPRHPRMRPRCLELDGGEERASLSFDSISPSLGTVRSELILSGTGFGHNLAPSASVRFGEAQATILSWSDFEVVVEVPELSPGIVDVVVHTALGITEPRQFNVIFPPMVYVNQVLPNEQNAIVGFGVDVQGGEIELTDAVQTVRSGVPTQVADAACVDNITVHKPSRRLFVANYDSIAVYNIDPATGALSPIAGNPFPTGAVLVQQIQVSDDLERLFAVNLGTAESFISSLPIGSDGSLGSGHSVLAMGSLSGLAISSDSSALAVMNVYTQGIAGYAIDAEGKPSPQGEFVVAPGMAPRFTIARPAHDQLFALWSTESTSALMKITFAFGSGSAGGALYDESSIPFSAYGFAFSTDGNVAYVGSVDSGLVSVLDVAVSGQPTERLGSPYNLAGVRRTTCIQTSAANTHLTILDVGSGELAFVRLDEMVTTATTDIGEGTPLGMVATF